MKRLALIILVMSAALAAHAHHPNHRNNRGLSSARIYADGPFDILVMVDGYQINRRPNGWVDLGNLAPGRYVIDVKALGPRRTKYTRHVIHVRPGYRSEYAVYTNGRRGPLFISREAMIPIGRPVRNRPAQYCGW